jgi:hypothetical protein
MGGRGASAVVRRCGVLSSGPAVALAGGGRASDVRLAPKQGMVGADRSAPDTVQAAPV